MVRWLVALFCMALTVEAILLVPGNFPVARSSFKIPASDVPNIRTAKALGLTIPQSLLLRADQVIE